MQTSCYSFYYACIGFQRLHGNTCEPLCRWVVRVNIALWLCCTAPTYRGGGVDRRSLHWRDDHIHGHCLFDSGVPVILSALALQARMISQLIWCDALRDYFQLLEKDFPHRKALVKNLFKMSCFWFRRGKSRFRHQFSVFNGSLRVYIHSFMLGYGNQEYIYIYIYLYVLCVSGCAGTTSKSFPGPRHSTDI